MQEQNDVTTVHQSQVFQYNASPTAELPNPLRQKSKRHLQNQFKIFKRAYKGSNLAKKRSQKR